MNGTDALEKVKKMIAKNDYHVIGFFQNNGVDIHDAPYDRIEWTDIYIVDSVGVDDREFRILRNEDEAVKLCRELRPNYASSVLQVRKLSDGSIDTSACYYTSNIIKKKEVA